MVERFHRQLKEALKARSASHSWPGHLPWVLAWEQLLKKIATYQQLSWCLAVLCEVPSHLQKVDLVFIRRGGSYPPLTAPYDGPFRVVERGPKVFQAGDRQAGGFCVGGSPEAVLWPSHGASAAAPQRSASSWCRLAAAAKLGAGHVGVPVWPESTRIG